MNVGPHQPDSLHHRTYYRSAAFHGLGYDVNGPNSGYNQILNTGFRAWYNIKYATHLLITQ